MSPLVSIISVNYNSTEVTLEMLRTLESLTYPNVEVIVVDNHSDSKPIEIKAKFPWVNLVVTDENLGYAGANNVGIEVARGEFCFFLNNDTEVTPGCIEPLVSILQQNIEVGAVSPKIYYFEGDKLIQYAGGKSLNPITGRGGCIGCREIDLGQYDRCGFTGFTHGAAMMVPKKVIQKVGGMPEQFFLYYEELDWCETIKRAGYKLVYQPNASIYHKESVTVGRKSPLRVYYMTRNRMVFLIRNNIGFQRKLGVLYYYLISTPFNLLRLITSKETYLLSSFIKGVLWNLKPSSKKLTNEDKVYKEKKYFFQKGKGEKYLKKRFLKTSLVKV